MSRTTVSYYSYDPSFNPYISTEECDFGEPEGWLYSLLAEPLEPQMGGIICPNQLSFDSDPSILGLLEKYPGFIYLFIYLQIRFLRKFSSLSHYNNLLI